MITILGIDAATVKTGYALIGIEGKKIKLLGFGTVTLKGALHERYNKLRYKVIELVQTYEPDHVCVEDLKFSKFAPTFSSLGKVAAAIGNVQAAFAECKYGKVYSIPANQVRAIWDVKQGKGASRKANLRNAINKKFLSQLQDKGRPDGFQKADEDATDALGLAVAVWLHEIQYE